MTSKNTNPDDLLAQLDDLSTEGHQKPRQTRPIASRAPKSGHGSTSQVEQDLLAELGNLAQRPSSRPGTPSLKPNSRQPGNQSPKRATTPNTASSRLSEDKATGSDRKSGDSARSSGNAFTPATTTADDSPAEEQPAPVPAQQASGGGGGWGGWFSSIASSAVTQAQAQVKNLQVQAQHQAEQRGIHVDAKTFTEQLRGNPTGLLKGLGVSSDTIGNLRSIAMPTFQNILQTIAPPISSHERLAVHITHDLRGYPSLDPTVYRVFERVMAQVEGGDLMVVQRGEEAGPKRSSRELGSRMGITSMSGAWSDGPWWRMQGPRSTNAVRGLAEGTKLVRASAEGYAADFFASKGGLEEAAKKATETLSESNPTRDSSIFLAIQAITQPISADLFAGSGASNADTEAERDSGDEFFFAVYLHDPIHGIAFSAVSQSVPLQWVDWLDAPGDVEGALPESIREIIDGGGVDPREWISEWMEETLSLAAGTVAQRYVARRMGVGESSSKSKGTRLKADINTAQVSEGGAGEAARAGI
ncbi:hypothetical protein LTR64_000234 [Lithohypha guttulata]|uniref:uncharacterized protein n=1 Tax=Lithohypha guttulata TaxID=1690604 RepID=UPI002DE15441|nr:hypothetical protein LTR51_007596 [Lithohypha guttulata]